MARNLESDLETLRTVLRLAQNRDFVATAALAEETLAGGFEHPMLLNIAATRLEQEGKYLEALHLLERAVAIAPNDVGARNALALCLQRVDRPAASYSNYRPYVPTGPPQSFSKLAANSSALLILLRAIQKVDA